MNERKKNGNKFKYELMLLTVNINVKMKKKKHQPRLLLDLRAHRFHPKLISIILIQY